MLEYPFVLPAHFEEATGLIGDVADREEAIFEAIASELGQVDDRE